jgi:RNA polymerase sigma factor (sigma-70 family)
VPERPDGNRDDDLPRATAQAEESFEEVPAETEAPREELIQLVRASADGDEAAWNKLIRLYAPLVLGVIRQYQLGQADAQDISQTVWLRLVEHLAHVDEPEALPRWLVATTRRECLRYYRQTQRLIPVDPHDNEVLERETAAEPDSGILQAELRQAVRDGLDELSSRDQLLLRLRTADPPLSYQEISQRLGMPVGSIGPVTQRSLHKLRQTRAVHAYMAADAPPNRASVGSGGAA